MRKTIAELEEEARKLRRSAEVGIRRVQVDSESMLADARRRVKEATPKIGEAADRILADAQALVGKKRTPSESERTTIHEKELPARPVNMDGEKSGTYVIDDTETHTVVVHCSDPRFRQVFDKFLREELGLKNWMPIHIPGSIHAVGIQDTNPKNWKILYQYLKYVITEKGMTRVVLINHDGCTYYQKLPGMEISRPLPERLRRDLGILAVTLLDDFAGHRVTVEGYHAKRTGNEVTFERVI